MTMPYDPHKNHRRSIRLRDYDYSRAGAYLVTMCVQGRQRIFGEIIDGKMNTNRFGEIVIQCWNDVPNRYQNVQTDAFVVMPDRVHGIIIINEDDTVGAIHELPRQEQQLLQTRFDPHP
jgi:REP element-mobilizing transposase RayT